MFEQSSQPVDIYCERLSAAFWAEPVNALTNFAFILAAVFAYSIFRQLPKKPLNLKIMIILAALVGIGSFIFHTVATKGAMLFDIIPIIIFIHYSLFLIFQRLMGLKWRLSLAGVFLFLAFNILTINIFGRTLFNGSIQYVPTFLLLATTAIYTRKRDFAFAAAIFLISLTCRSIDTQLCQYFPLGTHFLWHVLNAVTMYYVMKALIKVK